MKQIVSMMLCLVLLVGIIPVSAHVDETPISFKGAHPAESVEYDSPSYELTEKEIPQVDAASVTPMAGFKYRDMTSSQGMLDIIKDCEGFSSTPYWDYSQWTIGYGTGCGSSRDEVPAEYWDGISEAKGEELLRNYLDETAEAEVNWFFRKIGRQPTQNQFDAIVDFTYALGSGWMYEDSRVARYLKNPTTDLELVRALGAWCRVDGEVSSPACNRRMREAILYCCGWYLLPHGDIDSNLQVVHDGDLPMFNYVIYEGNGTTLINTRTDDVNYYLNDGRYNSLLRPNRESYGFSGWKYKGGDRYLMEGHTVRNNVRVVAQWTRVPFRDMDLHSWYVPGIPYCYANKIMKGIYDDQFGVYDEASRAMVVSVLYRMAGSPRVEGKTGLTDIDGEKHYYTKAVKWAVDNKIVAGYSDKTFRPDQSVSRAEMVAFLYRYAKFIKKADVSASDQLSRFEDRSSVPGYAVASFNWALDRQIIQGTHDYTLGARDPAVRAMLAKTLMGVDNLENRSKN